MPVSIKWRSMNCSATMPTRDTINTITTHSTSRSSKRSARIRAWDMGWTAKRLRLLLRCPDFLDETRRPDLAFVVLVHVLPRRFECRFVGHDVSHADFLQILQSLRIDLLTEIGSDLAADLSGAFEEILLLFGER